MCRGGGGAGLGSEGAGGRGGAGAAVFSVLVVCCSAGSCRLHAFAFGLERLWWGGGRRVPVHFDASVTIFMILPCGVSSYCRYFLYRTAARVLAPLGALSVRTVLCEVDAILSCRNAACGKETPVLYEKKHRLEQIIALPWGGILIS